MTFLIVLLALITTCLGAATELTWDSNNRISLNEQYTLLHFKTTPAQQFYVEHVSTTCTNQLSLVLKYSCGTTNCDPQPSCTTVPSTCNFNYTMNQPQMLFPYAPSSTDANARNSCGCDVSSLTMEQNWFILVERSDVAACDIVIRVHDGLIPLNNSQSYTLTLLGNSITQAFMDIPRNHPIEITLVKGSCGSATYFHYRYTCSDGSSPSCGPLLTYPPSTFCGTSADCNSGTCEVGGACTCTPPYSGPDCSYFTTQTNGSTTVWANYNSQPFEYQHVLSMPGQRATTCGCTSTTATERWYFAVYNQNPTDCVVTFTVSSNVATSMGSSSYSDSLQPFQGKYYKFGVESQVLGLQVAQMFAGCSMAVALHQTCGGDCIEAPYWNNTNVTNYDIYESINGAGNMAVNITFLENEGNPLLTCGCDSAITNSDVFLTVLSTTSSSCSYSIDATFTDLCAAGVYDPLTSTCQCLPGSYGDYCQNTLSTCETLSLENTYTNDTCVALNSSSCLCTVGFGSSYLLPTILAPETETIEKGWYNILTPNDDKKPQFDVFSMLSYKFFNAKNSKEVSIHLGHFDTPFPVQLQVVMSVAKEPDVILIVTKGNSTTGKATYLNLLQYYDPSIKTGNLTANGTIVFTDLEPEQDYYFKVAAVGLYSTDTSNYTVKRYSAKNYYKPLAFAFTTSVEPNNTYAKTVNVALLIILIIILLIPCIAIPIYRLKFRGKSFLPKMQVSPKEEQETSLLKKLAFILLKTAFYLAFRLFRAVFNLSILFYSFGVYVDFPDISELWDLFPDNMQEVLADWSNFLGNLSTYITKFAFLDDHFCTGAIAVTYLISIVIASYFLFITLRMNLLISIVLGTRRYFTGKHKILVSIYGSLAEAVGNAFFYLIQFAVFTIYNVLDGLFKLKGGCSEYDKTFNDNFKIFGYIAIAPLTILCIYAFMPQKSEPEANPYGNKLQIMIRHMLNTLIRGAFGILQVSLGLWNPYTVKSYQIKERALKYDDDPNDNDSRQEAVIGMTGKAVSLIWLLIPGLAVVTKFTEVVSENIIFDDPRAELDLASSKPERIRKFILAGLVLGLEIGTVFTLSFKVLSAVFGIVFAQAVEKLLTDLYKLLIAKSTV